MNHLNKMMEIYLIYLILEELLMLGLEEVLADKLLVGYELVLVVKLTEVIMENLD